MKFIKFPFGKFKGVDIREIESTYLVYALENFSLPDELSSAILYEISARLGNVILNDAITKEHITFAYKKLALIYHPDKGGSDLAMQAINDFKFYLIG